MEWLNEPASWQRTGDVLTVSVDPSTDFWRETGYGYIRDSGHVYGEVLAGDLDVSVRMRCTLGTQYDQAGVMLRADERTWLKTGVEFFEGRARLSTVLTLGRSSWMVTDLPEGTDEIVLRVSRRGDAVEVRYVIEDGPAELAALVFMPPGREVLAGVMAAAPEGPGFRITFHDLRITEPDWSPAAGRDPSWPDDQAGWAGDEQPAWDAADGEPGWAAPGTGEDAPAWPATAEEETPAWPVPAVAAEEPQWQPPAAGDDDQHWPVTAAREDDHGWRDPAGEEEDPGWVASGDDEPGWVASLAGDGDDEPGWAAAPAAAEVSDAERDEVDEAAVADSPGPAGPAGPEPAEDGPPGAGPIAAAPPGTQPAPSGPAEPEAAGDEAGEPGTAAAHPAADEDPADEYPAAGEAAAGEAAAGDPPGGEPADKNGDGEPWSPAPLASDPDWARPATGDAQADVDPAADWERLAAGAQAAARAQGAGEKAARWRAQTDADVANEWPGPPLRTAMRNGLLGSDAGPRPDAGQPADDAQTDPGLPRPRPAAGGPGRTEAGLPASPENGTPGAAENGAAGPPEASAAGPPEASAAAPDETAHPPDETGPAAPTRPDPPERPQSARQARRARSRRAAADAPAEPDAADEWISLLTADPVEE
jgi:regulation of enolase protein 1 (concanavalin A-like superfamily)